LCSSRKRWNLDMAVPPGCRDRESNRRRLPVNRRRLV
jgi:hypothetical protein